MPKDKILTRILDSAIVAVIRSPDGEILTEVAEALLAGGVEVLEVTFTVPGALKVLEQVSDRLGDKVVLGAGTILDSHTARMAMLSGASFIVSPTTNLDIIRTCRRYDVPVMPGAFTPTEVLSAWEAGADIVKIFPADVSGPSYLKALSGPLPQVRLMPTGGVNLNTAADFLRAGACALGVGGALVSGKAIAERDFDGITAMAKKYVEIVQQTRAS